MFNVHTVPALVILDENYHIINKDACGDILHDWKKKEDNFPWRPSMNSAHIGERFGPSYRWNHAQSTRLPDVLPSNKEFRNLHEKLMRELKTRRCLNERWRGLVYCCFSRKARDIVRKSYRKMEKKREMRTIQKWVGKLRNELEKKYSKNTGKFFKIMCEMMC